MQKWEILIVDFEGGVGYLAPNRIEFLPTGVMDLNWVKEQFPMIRVIQDGERRNAMGNYRADVIENLGREASSVSMAVIKYFGDCGWEALELSSHSSFKRLKT